MLWIPGVPTFWISGFYNKPACSSKIMLWGEGRNAENFLSILPFFKNTWKYLFPTPWFCLQWNGQHQAGADWLSQCQRTVGHCKVFCRWLSSQWPLPKRTGKGQICLWISQSLWTLHGFPSALQRSSISSHMFSFQSFSNLTSFAPDLSRLIFSHSWLLIPSASILHFLTQPKSPLIIPFWPCSTLSKIADLCPSSSSDFSCI